MSVAITTPIADRHRMKRSGRKRIPALSHLHLFTRLRDILSKRPSPPTHPAVAVANAILDLADSLNCAVSYSKLRNLVYLADRQMRHVCGAPMVTDHFHVNALTSVHSEALYLAFRKFGLSPIRSRATNRCGAEITARLSPSELEILQDMVGRYGANTAAELTEITKQSCFFATPPV